MAECGKGWTNRCAAAKGKKCRCRCGGANHGATRQKFEDDSPRRSSDEELYYGYDEKKRRQFLPTHHEITAVRFSRNPDRSPIVELMFPGAPAGKREEDYTDNELLAGLDVGKLLRHRYQRHSPDGFEFGYGGSGPAECALNLLAEFIGVKNATENGLYQDFKFAFIAPLDQEKGGVIPAEEIRMWVRGQWNEMAKREASSAEALS